MANKYSGLQSRIKFINPLAGFGPCAAHSLNLMGVKAVKAIYFLNCCRPFPFFFIISHHLQILDEKLKKSNKRLTLKSVCDTILCTDSKAVRALQIGYPIVLNALQDICDEENKNNSTKADVSSQKV